MKSMYNIHPKTYEAITPSTIDFLLYFTSIFNTPCTRMKEDQTYTNTCTGTLARSRKEREDLYACVEGVDVEEDIPSHYCPRGQEAYPETRIRSKYFRALEAQTHCATWPCGVQDSRN